MTTKRPVRTPLQYIRFAVEQAHEAEEFGVPRNEACRNLKTALHQHWQHKILGMHGDVKKEALPRSLAAVGRPRNDLVVEHVVPMQVIVNLLLDSPRRSERSILALLQRLYIVRAVTKAEDERLRGTRLRSQMPPDWDQKDPWARYKAAGIRLVGGYRHRVSRR